MRYDRAAADAARAERPGRGHRADVAAEVIEPEEFVRLTNDDAIPAEHRALWTLLWEGGLRVGDALSLNVRDVDLDEHKVNVDYPKTERDERVIPLSDQFANLTRAAIGDRTDGPLFVNQRGMALSRPLMGSEDIPLFGMAAHNGGADIPYAYWFIGGTPWAAWEAVPGDTPGEKLLSVPGNHTARFAPDPATIETGVTAMTRAALVCFGGPEGAGERPATGG